MSLIFEPSIATRMRLNIKSSPSAFFSSTLSYHKKLQQLTENMEGIQKISALGEDRPG
ncbi:hypothetical protein B4098_0632 [Heyndrickxia coagulans]|uniref:Uncharacterized protein n=1 Tax=Heyndrickxia coagulans TaxID=1398 RepID=A0A150K156_HEYCO|nr:hypothetical protein B4098_0632 [Heyndrickxia coagulans]